MEDTIGIIVAVAAIYLAYSWLFKPNPNASNTSPSASSASSSSSTTAPVMGQGILRGVSEPMVQSVQSMFPDVPRNAILWDLSKTKKVESTVERILSVGTLPMPPTTLFPPPPPSTPPTLTSPSSASPSTATPLKGPTLLDRFNLPTPPAPSLKGKERAQPLDLPSSSSAASENGRTNAAKWESTPEARERSLKERKEKMILEARRKLLEKKKRETELAEDGQDV